MGANDLNGVCSYGMIQAVYLMQYKLNKDGVSAPTWTRFILELGQLVFNALWTEGFANPIMVADWVAESRWLIGSYVIDQSLEAGRLYWPILPPGPALSYVSLPSNATQYLQAALYGPRIRKQSRKLEIAFFGVHATLLAEPVSVLDHLLGPGAMSG